MDKVRNAVVDLLVQVEQDQSYSTISLKRVIEQQKWTAKDKGLLTELFYGTIQRKMTIDFYLAPYIQKSKENSTMGETIAENVHLSNGIFR